MDQPDLFRYAVELLDRLRIPYMVVGSLASGVWGDPRYTQDIDIVIAPTVAQLRVLCDGFPADEFYVSHEAALDALCRQSQFNVLHPDSGQKIDFMIARADAWGQMQLGRREKVKLLPDLNGYAARPEDIILSKMLYYKEGGSEKHLRDICGILRISRDAVDREYVVRWARELDVMDVWEAVLRRMAM